MKNMTKRMIKNTLIRAQTLTAKIPTDKVTCSTLRDNQLNKCLNLSKITIKIRILIHILTLTSILVTVNKIRESMILL